MQAKQAFQRLSGLEYAAEAALANLNEARKALGLSPASITTEPQQLRRLTDKDRQKLVRDARKKQRAEDQQRFLTTQHKREAVLEVVRRERRKKEQAIAEHNERIEKRWNQLRAEGDGKAS